MFGQAALWIEAVGSLYILGYVLAGLAALLRGPAASRLIRARLLVAEGVLAGLNFKVAASLLKTIQLESWQQIALFVATFALRTVLKRFFVWEQRQLLARQRGEEAG
ncbi:hypothetical protein DKM44_07445 [Deinococcus irradiatisoli]|uniref:DUF1622 domain-containing protein n=1 Tax=Deinococcus irradiatisoli TaxID=2202254 RepID=A0A2Z3JDG8_9DEIO|nr:DUF1622 domain-containing protein [Deinococcus irradiatisoli]AWN23082.1 hypothetical protein DKM44_07445 [Deinococcus irradiatisoli]